MKINKDIDFLHKPCVAVKENEAKSLKLKLYTFLVVNSKKAVGVAANQLGVNKKAFAVRLNNKIEVFINPSIELSGETIDSEEGCLSIPNEEFIVKRRMNVKISADNQSKPKGYRGYQACVIQHEMDHLNGILINDKGEDNVR